MSKHKTQVLHTARAVIAVFLCIAMTSGILFNSNLMIDVFAAEEIANATPITDFTYTVDMLNGTVTLTKYNGSGTEVRVPPTYTVDSLEFNTVVDSTTTFKSNKTITYVKLYPGVSFANNTLRYLFYDCSKLLTADISGVNTVGVTNMSNMFDTDKAITTIDMTGIDTSKVTNMNYLFYKCQNLSTLTGYENWDTGSVQTMYYMFLEVTKLKKIDLSRWNLSNVVNSCGCFQKNNAEEILLPDSLKTISAFFFNHSQYIKGTSFTIPAGVERIGYGHTFYNFATDALTEFIVPAENKNFVAVDGILYSADMKELLAIPRGKTFENDTFYVPEGVEFMGENSFSRNYNFKTIVLPNSFEIEQFVDIGDPRYIVFEDRGNVNEGNSLTVATYIYTSVENYGVRYDNPRYKSVDGIIYSKDMSTVLAIPIRYHKHVNIPEGVTTWETHAASYTQENVGGVGDFTGVSIPSTMLYIAPDQVDKINFTNRTISGFSITVHPDNPVYTQDANGNIISTGAVAWNRRINEIYYDLPSAFADAQDGDTIILLADTELSSKITVSSDITLTGGYTVTRADDYTGGFFEVSSGASLTLDGGVVFDGNNEWVLDREGFEAVFEEYKTNSKLNRGWPDYITLEEGAPNASGSSMFKVSGTLTVNRATIKNNFGRVIELTNNGAEESSVCNINDGALITHNILKGGGVAVYVSKNAQLNINGGEISNNHGVENGVTVTVCGTATMTGGIIKDNTGANSNGIALMVYSPVSDYTATFHMSGGEICGNKGLRGGANGHGSAIYLHSYSHFIMTGGKICHNKGLTSGGILCYQSLPLVTITGGELVENVSYGQYTKANELYHDIHDFALGDSTAFITGGVFSQNIEKNLSDGYGTKIDFVNSDGEEFAYFTVVTELVENARTGERYDSIGAASADAEDGDTLEVLYNHQVYVNSETISKDLTIDLNGYTIYGWDAYSKYLDTMYKIEGDVTFVNDPASAPGGLNSSKKSNSSAFTVGTADGSAVGTLTIKDGNYISDGNIITVNSGELNVEDGYFYAVPENGKYALDCGNANYVNETASITLTGGIYKSFDPEENGAEGTGTNFCADTHESLYIFEDTWKVVSKIPVYVCRNVRTGELYQSVMLGFNDEDLQDGDTIQLITSASEGDVLIPPTTSLDLNGFSLTVINIVGVKSTRVYDSANCAANGYSADGVLKIREMMVLSEENENAVPVYSPTKGGYIFLDFLFNQGQDKFGDVSRVNALVTSRTTEVITLLKDGASDNDIQIGVRLTVNDEESRLFVFTDLTIENVMNSNGGKFNLFERMFYANFTGIEEFDSVKADVLVLAHGNVIDKHTKTIILK